MKKNWKEIIKNICLFVALLFVTTWLTSGYAMEEDGPTLTGVFLAILISYVWKKIDKKFFK